MAASEWDKVKKFKGQWVAMWKDKVVGHGPTLKEAFAQASKVCKEPRVFQVPSDEDEVYLL